MIFIKNTIFIVCSLLLYPMIKHSKLKNKYEMNGSVFFYKYLKQNNAHFYQTPKTKIL